MGSDRGDVPGTSKPMYCGQKNEDGNRCGERATTVMDMVIKVMDRQIPVKVPFCEKHAAIFKPEITDYSIVEKES